jgi:heme-degrading monooxygenase HmoA
MIVDLVTFRVKQDRIKEFERHNEEWLRVMRRTRGFVTQSLMRSIERPSEYLAAVRWVSRDFRDRFNAADDAERRALQQKARDLLDGPPTSVLLENV